LRSGPASSVLDREKGRKPSLTPMRPLVRDIAAAE